MNSDTKSTLGRLGGWCSGDGGGGGFCFRMQGPAVMDMKQLRKRNTKRNCSWPKWPDINRV